MILAITEQLGDISHDPAAVHGKLIACALPEDRSQYGYAAVRSGPVARYEGVAVVFGDNHLSGVPDPVRVLVREEGGADPDGATLVVRRRALPLIVRVDSLARSAIVLRRVPPPETQETQTSPPAAPAEQEEQDLAPVSDDKEIG